MKQLYRGKASLLYRATCRASRQPVALKLYRKHKLSALNWYQVRKLFEIRNLASLMAYIRCVWFRGSMSPRRHCQSVADRRVLRSFPCAPPRRRQ